MMQSLLQQLHNDILYGFTYLSIEGQWIIVQWSPLHNATSEMRGGR